MTAIENDIDAPCFHAGLAGVIIQTCLKREFELKYICTFAYVSQVMTSKFTIVSNVPPLKVHACHPPPTTPFTSVSSYFEKIKLKHEKKKKFLLGFPNVDGSCDFFFEAQMKANGIGIYGSITLDGISVLVV